ncbi:MAG TPA: DnaA regulatory inactivator Hda [Burkholderiaceae bacterium]|nr:DnaA regulatory inactivator Hda [Burkholderiaceae bacterium]
MRQIPLAIGVEAARTFDNFVAGANALAIAHLRALAPQAAPVYLWGPSGAGKTHLLHALVGRAEAQGLRAGWFSAADAAPWSFDEAWALIAIDDCDALDVDQQHAAFALFVEAATRGIPIAGAGRVPPVDLAVREDLRTRLGWGHVFAIAPLGEPEVRATLRREADRRGIFLSDEVMDYLLTRFARDLKHLMAQLDRLDEFSLASKRAITVPLLKQMLVEEGGA